jgi:hypothetical protein
LVDHQIIPKYRFKNAKKRPDAIENAMKLLKGIVKAKGSLKYNLKEIHKQ